jgi:hypothetical protein
VNVILFGSRLFAGVIRDFNMKSDGFQEDPKSNDSCPYKRREKGM